MAVTKRTRFEVLKRDNYTCRYCRSTEGELTIDHVLPVALGGSDAPDNLVAACRDCNAGKSSASPDAALVADVSEDAIRWARAVKMAAEHELMKQEQRDDYVRQFLDAWGKWGDDRYLPNDWEESVMRWHRDGVPIDFLTDSVFITWGKSYIDKWRSFAYMAGVLKRKMSDLHEKAREIFEEETANGA